MSSCNNERPIRTTYAYELMGELLSFQKESNRKLNSIKRSFTKEASPYIDMSKRPDLNGPVTPGTLDAWRDRAHMLRTATDELYDAVIAQIREKAAEINPEALAALATNNLEPGAITYSGAPVNNLTREQAQQWLEGFKQGLVKLADVGEKYKKDTERWEALVRSRYQYTKLCQGW